MRSAVRTGWIILLMVGMLGSFSGLASADIESLSADDAYRQARQAYAKGQFDQALDLLRHAHNKDPKALYVYNMGRILEAIGRLQEAHETYLRVTALSNADAKVRNLSQAQIDKLLPLLKVAVLRFRSLPEGSVVQVSDDMVLTLSQDLELKPGMYQVCVLGAKGKSIRCWRRDFKAGSRTAWPLDSPKATRSKILWKGVKDAKQLTLDGHTLLLSVKKLVSLEVDVGKHMIGVVGAKKKRTVQASVIPGETQKLADLLKGPRKKATAGVKGEAGAGDAGFMPWVVTGVGGAMVAGGAVLAVMGSQDNDAAYEGDDGQQDTEALVDAANQKITTGYIVAGVGVAAVAGGLTWWWMDNNAAPAKRKAAGKKQAQWWISPVGFTTVFVGGRF